MLISEMASTKYQSLSHTKEDDKYDTIHSMDLPDDQVLSNETLQGSTTWRAERLHAFWLKVLLFILAQVLSLGGIIFILQITNPSVTAALSTWFSGHLPHCGDSLEEARSLGCLYDPMINSWIPPDCHFPTLFEEALAFNNTWYYDKDMQHQIPMTVLMRGEVEAYWPGPGHHQLHCLYTWKKLLWSIDKGVLADSYSASYEHGNHCIGWLMAPNENLGNSTRAFGRCVSITV
jgi:hypothetical protein